jgi:hypothetical protein
VRRLETAVHQQTTQAAGTPPDKMPTVEVPANEDAQAGAAAAAALLVDLQHDAIEHERAVPGDAALFLVLTAKNLRRDPRVRA